MNWLKPRTDSVMVKEPDVCPHDDWVIEHHNRAVPPHGTCKRCGEEMKLYILLNNWKARIERELRGD